MIKPLDRLDLGIMKMLLINNGVPPPGNPALKKSFRSMAKELGVDQGSIRKRMKRLQEQRVLKGWYLGINPGLIGQDVVYVWLTIEDESDKGDAVERLLSLPNLERACNYLGPKLKMILLCDKGTDTGKMANQLEHLAGSRATLRHQAFVEVPALRAHGVDLAIVGNLRRDPLKPRSVVAKELGLSARTVKRRVERLSEDGAIYMLPIIDLKALRGMIPIDIIVDYVSKDSKPEVNEKITTYAKEELMFSGSFGPRGYFALWVPNVYRVEQIAKWVKRQAGVREAHVDLLQDIVLNRNHFERKQIQTTSDVASHVAKVSARTPIIRN